MLTLSFRELEYGVAKVVYSLAFLLGELSGRQPSSVPQASP